MINYAFEATELLKKVKESDKVIINANLISELWAFVTLFQRWENHPAWNEIRESLKNSDDVLHSMILFASDSFLADQDNGVGLVFGQKNNGRIPDIYVQTNCVEKLELEVKTPKLLRGSVDNFTQNIGEKMIEDLVNKAASKKRGQLNSMGSGMLVIGGFHIKKENIDILEKCATSILAKQILRKSHLMGILLCIQTYEHITTVNENGEVLSQAFRPIMITRFIKHPGYLGDLKIITE